VIAYRKLDFAKDWTFISGFISPILCADTCGIIAHNDQGEYKACAVFDSFTVSSCNVHLGIKSPIVLRHGFLPIVAEFAFNFLKRERIFGLTPDNNFAAIKFNKHIGMQEVARIPDAYDEGVGYVVTRMDKATSPWLQVQEKAA